MEQLEADPMPIMKSSIAEAMGALAQILVPNSEWNELFEFVFTKYHSDSVDDRWLAMLLLSVVIEYISSNFIREHYDKIHEII